MAAPGVTRSALAGYGLLSAAFGALEVTSHGGSGSVFIDASMVLSVGAIVLGIATHRPKRPLIWWILVASILSFLAGGMIYQVDGAAIGRDPALNVFPQCFLILGTGLLIAGLVAATRAMSPKGDRASVLDASILTVAVAALLWSLVIWPLLDSSKDAGLTRLATALYPAFDVVLLALVLHILLVNPRRPFALWAIVGALASSFASNLGEAIAATHGGPGNITLFNLGWLATSALIGLGALHPSMRAVCEASPTPPPRLGTVRVVALASALAAPSVAVVLGTTALGQAFRPADLLFPSVVVTALVIARVRGLCADSHRARAQVELSERRFRALIENQADHVLVVDEDGTITYQSPSLLRILGYGPDELLGKAARTMFVDAEHEAWLALVKSAAHEAGASVNGTLKGRDAAGDEHGFEVALTNLLADPAVAGITVVLHDVTERTRFEGELQLQALHDPLTGLANRALLLERSEQMLASCLRHRTSMAALFIDLDNFKSINDSLGHGAGDELLVAVADRLRNAIRAEDTVGRLGGDEFVVLLDPTSLGAGPEIVAERLLDTLRAPFEVAHRQYRVSVSMGVAVGDTGSPDDLLRSADIAMYQAKAAGKDRYVVFATEMQVAAHDWLSLEIDLQEAIGQGQLSVVYQPTVDLDQLRISGMEALVRWNHPTRGLLMPAEFIPIAEASGLIVDLGRFVLREACLTAASWSADSLGGPLTVSVNVSTRQLESPRLVPDVERALSESGLDPNRLVLEVTETTLMNDATGIVPRIVALKQLGVRIAIDDFGTGYSSLSYLRQLPVDVLKIDRSFVSSMQDSTEAVAVVQTLLHLGKTLGLEIVAEGVELATQLDILRREGCHIGQGFLFARPLDPALLDQFLADWALGITPAGVEPVPG